MAISSNTCWEVRTAAADTNGGAFAAGVSGKDVSAATDLAVDATLNTKVTSGSYNFTSADVGKFINVTSGTGWTAGWYQILSTASNAATLDHSPAPVSTTSGTYNLYSGIDYSQQTGTQVTFNGSTITATTAGTGATITITGYTTTINDVGNIVQITGGTNFTTGFYTITAQGTGTWTLDRNCTSGAGAAMTGAMGGALASITKVLSAMIAGNTAWVKADGTYTTTATMTSSVGSNPTYAAPFNRLFGYTTTRGDNGRPTIQLSTTSNLTALDFHAGTAWFVRNFIIDCNNLTGSNGLSNAAYGIAQNIKVINYKGIGLKTAAGVILSCEVTAGATGAASAINAAAESLVFNNYVHDGVGPGIIAAGATVIGNIVASQSGVSSDGIQLTSLLGWCLGNTIYNCGRHGIFNNIQYNNYTILNNILVSNGGYGIVGSTNAGTAASILFDGNVFYNNTSGTREYLDDQTTNIINGIYPYQNTHDIILTASPFVNTSAGDFRLNTTPGGGASCRGAGLYPTFPGLSSPDSFSYPDMGAVQHQDSPATIIVNQIVNRFIVNEGEI